jgi:hypothetical protein
VKNDHALIAQLATSWWPATDIGLRVQAKPLGEASARILRIEAQLDLHEVTLEQKDQKWTGDLQSVFLQLDADGRILKVDDRTFHPEFDAATYEGALKSGIADTREVRVLPRTAQLCIVVRDADSSKMGSIYLPMAPYFPSQGKPQ